MEFLLIVALAVVVYLLWQRLNALEHRFENAEHDLDRVARRMLSEETVATVAPAAKRREEPDAIVRSQRTAPPPEPLIEPEPAPAPELIAAPAARPDPQHVESAEPIESSRIPRLDFEDIFGRLLPIWAGGITLAVAGFLIVRYSIEAGLLTPSARVVLSLLFGIGLIGGAEAARRFEIRVSDPRVGQALAGAGIATLYTSLYLAGAFYGLIAPQVAFSGMSAVTLGAVLLSYRFGVPSAVLGLIGGFATPLLAGGSEANIPLLTLYLALVTAGLMVSARQRRWAWLGLAALGGGLGWGLLLLAGGTSDGTDVIALGAFVIVLGAILPRILPLQLGDKSWIADGLAAVLAALQMAVLVEQADFSLLAWGMFLLLALALAALGWNKPQLRRVSGFASVIIPLLLLGWDNPPARDFALVVPTFALLLAGVPVAQVWRGASSRIDRLQILPAALGLFVATAWHVGTMVDQPENLTAFAAFALAAFPLAASWRLWPAVQMRARFSLLALSATTMLLVLVGGMVLAPEWAFVFIATAIGAAWLILVRQSEDVRLWSLGWVGLAIIVLLLQFPIGSQEVDRLGEFAPDDADIRGALRWAVQAGLFALAAHWDPRRLSSFIVEALAALLAYGALAQILQSEPLAWLAAICAIAVGLGLRERWTSQLVFLTIAACWAIEPLGQWLVEGARALAGDPMLVTRLPNLANLALYVMPVLVAAGQALWQRRALFGRHASLVVIALALPMLVALHIGFKHVLAIPDTARFVDLGIVERSAWEVLLIGLAWGAWRLRERSSLLRPLAVAAAATAMLHWAWFGVVLHNPLWSEQAVGSLPVANLVLALYTIGLGMVFALYRIGEEMLVRYRPALNALAMLLIALLGFGLLRQTFSGSLLMAVPVMQLEDMLRSLLGIVLAIGFLLWGARSDQRSWRIGSLVLMLLAVGKVFLVDAAGLEGLARIASFVALGFSLIGIGWFYSRQLRVPPFPTPREPA